LKPPVQFLPPNISLVYLDIVLPEKRPEFILEGLAFAVRLLIINVTNGSVDIGNADAERAVAFLPFKRGMHGKSLMHPF
jgi:hypothetical protein